MFWQLIARDIYVYNGTNPVQTIKDIKKITFTTGVMNIEQKNGSIVPISMSNFDNFSFFEKKGLTSVHSIYTEGIDFSFDGQTVKVNQAQRITVYSAQGVELLRQNIVGSKNSQISLRNYPTGLYIIEIITQEKTYTQKIWKK